MKNRMTTRGFSLASALILTTAAPACASGMEPPADTVYKNAFIYTADSSIPEASAVAIKEGKFVYVGDSENVDLFIGEHTQTYDMEGLPLLPGFIDNHNHVFEAASEAGGMCELSPEEDMEGQYPYLEACTKDLEPGQWVTGYGHVFESISDKLSDPMPIEVLDDVFPDNPVIFMEQTSHSMIANSAALELADIDENTPDPQGGIIMKDKKTGKLNGVLFDNAGDIVMEIAWNSLDSQYRLSYDGLLNGLHEASSNGITTIGDGRMYWRRGWHKVWQDALDNGDITARVSLRPWIYPEEKPQPQLKFLKNILQDNKNQLLITNQIKLYSDGILHFGTAKMLDDYEYTPNENYPKGLNYIPPTKLKWWLNELNNIGYGAHIHAIGDGGVRESLNAIESVRKKGSKRQYNMTHLEVINPNDLPRFKALKVDADFQIGSEWSMEGHHDWAAEFIGKHKVHHMLPIRSLVNSGANVVLSSDWNVNPISPLAAISNSQLQKKGPLFDIYGAIDAYTINPAKALGLDDVTGSITVGKSADLVALDRDITKLNPKKIPEAKVLFTVLQGAIVYDAEQ